jgi:hypothetical protein
LRRFLYKANRQRLIAIAAASIVVAYANLATIRMAIAAEKDLLITHLEFLGYQCDVIDQGLRARHASNITLLFTYARGGIQIQTAFPGNSTEMDSVKRFALLNKLNEAARVARFFWTEKGNLFVSAWMPGLYDKTRFAALMESWHDDIETLRKVYKEISPYLKPSQ